MGARRQACTARALVLDGPPGGGKGGAQQEAPPVSLGGAAMGRHGHTGRATSVLGRGRGGLEAGAQGKAGPTVAPCPSRPPHGGSRAPPVFGVGASASGVKAAAPGGGEPPAPRRFHTRREECAAGHRYWTARGARWQAKSRGAGWCAAAAAIGCPATHRAPAVDRAGGGGASEKQPGACSPDGFPHPAGPPCRYQGLMFGTRSKPSLSNRTPSTPPHAGWGGFFPRPPPHPHPCRRQRRASNTRARRWRHAAGQPGRHGSARSGAGPWFFLAPCPLVSSGQHVSHFGRVRGATPPAVDGGGGSAHVLARLPDAG
jgi:hypothetical protein